MFPTAVTTVIITRTMTITVTVAVAVAACSLCAPCKVDLLEGSGDLVSSL